jgi:hypothetical protein
MIGNTLWYVATWEDEWLALLSFSTAVLKCGARNRWIGWDSRHQHNRLNLIANNSYSHTHPPKRVIVQRNGSVRQNRLLAR